VDRPRPCDRWGFLEFFHLETPSPAADERFANFSSMKKSALERQTPASLAGGRTSSDPGITQIPRLLREVKILFTSMA
jgi:hypothetical protein